MAFHVKQEAPEAGPGTGGSDATILVGDQPTTLQSWIIRLDNGSVYVQGYIIVRTTLQKRITTPIAKRIDSRTLRTKAGNIIKLDGDMNEKLAAGSGIPAHLIERFECGFPRNWEELIRGEREKAEVVTVKREVKEEVVDAGVEPTKSVEFQEDGNAGDGGEARDDTNPTRAALPSLPSSDTREPPRKRKIITWNEDDGEARDYSKNHQWKNQPRDTNIDEFPAVRKLDGDSQDSRYAKKKSKAAQRGSWARIADGRWKGRQGDSRRSQDDLPASQQGRSWFRLRGRIEVQNRSRRDRDASQF